MKLWYYNDRYMDIFPMKNGTVLQKFAHCVSESQRLQKPLGHIMDNNQIPEDFANAIPGFYKGKIIYNKDMDELRDYSIWFEFATPTEISKASPLMDSHVNSVASIDEQEQKIPSVVVSLSEYTKLQTEYLGELYNKNREQFDRLNQIKIYIKNYIDYENNPTDIKPFALLSPDDACGLTNQEAINLITGYPYVLHGSLSIDRVRELTEEQRKIILSGGTEEARINAVKKLDEFNIGDSVIVSPVWNRSPLTDTLPTGVSHDPSFEPGKKMTEADYFDSSEEINDKFKSLRASINSFNEYALNKNNQIGIDVANKLNEKIRLLSSNGSSLTTLDKEIINQMKGIIINSYKELGPTADGIGYFHTLLRNISLCLSYLSSLISGSQCDDIDQKSVAVGQINTTFFARSTRQEKVVEIIDEELNKLIENHPKSGR